MTYDSSISFGELQERKQDGVNVGQAERVASTIAGGALIGYALVSRSKTAILCGIFGASLVYRGASGKCEAYRKLGINTAESEGSDEIAREIHVKKSIMINRPAEELYSFWRSFENLPRFMPNLKSVTEIDENESHWVATTPAGKTFEWDAEIYNDVPNEVIAWRSLSNSDVTHAGSVNFKPAPAGRGTCVEVTFNYNPPGGVAAVFIARLFGSEPGQIVEQNLRRLKQLFEAGVVPTIEGQTSGRLQAAKPVVEENEDETTTTRDSVTGLSHEAKGGVR